MRHKGRRVRRRTTQQLSNTVECTDRSAALFANTLILSGLRAVADFSRGFMPIHRRRSSVKNHKQNIGGAVPPDLRERRPQVHEGAGAPRKVDGIISCVVMSNMVNCHC